MGIITSNPGGTRSIDVRILNRFAASLSEVATLEHRSLQEFSGRILENVAQKIASYNRSGTELVGDDTDVPEDLVEAELRLVELLADGERLGNFIGFDSLRLDDVRDRLQQIRTLRMAEAASHG
jgi:hypothetical protein